MDRADFLGRAWWPMDQLGGALRALAHAHDLAPESGKVSDIVGMPPETGNLDSWMAWAGARLGIEAVPVSASVRDLGSFLQHGGPAIVQLERNGARGFLALAGQRRNRPLFLCPDGRRIKADTATIEGLLTSHLVDDLRPEVSRVLSAAHVKPSRRNRVGAAMVRERIGGEMVSGLTMLRLSTATDFGKQMRHAGLHLRLAQIVGLFLLLYGAELWGWKLIGGATLSGTLDWGRMAAWGLLTLTMVPWHLMAGWSEAMFSLETGRLVKARLLAGAMALPSDAVKRQGVGTLISKVMESQALEGLALGGGFSVLVGLIELGFAAWVLSLGASPAGHLILLGIFALASVLLGIRYHRRIVEWIGNRLGMTHYLVEAMVGHRTRLAQERAARRDVTEDGQLSGYFRSATRMDQTGLAFGPGMTLAWSVAALLGLAPALLGSEPPQTAQLAISLGGMLLAQRALSAIGSGVASLSRAGFAWGRVREIFRAGNTQEKVGALPGGGMGGPRTGPVIEARELRFAHEGASAAVLTGANVSIASGDRILIEGPSGGGKSTLANLLTGLRKPDGGLLLLDGLDRPTIGDDWHARVTAAPQFHDNHILSGTLAFNLLMGRQWPPSDADLAEAEALCEDLGLGELLRRMPGGLHQRVGETGWQLSHGERSRIFLARALLQKADVTILDESFASLDPATMDLCLTTALREAQTLVVIAHP